MHSLIQFVVIAGFSFSLSISPARAEEKTFGEKSAAVWSKTKQKTKEVSKKVVNKTQKAVAAAEDAVDKPDADAKKIDVKVTDKGVQMPKQLAAGKTAFVVANTGKEKHNFEIEGNNLGKSFWLAIAPGASKTMQVDLTPGTYEADCKLHEGKEPKVQLTVK